MNIVQKIKALVQEAELYRSQGLYNESIVKYRNAEKLIKENEHLKGREKLLGTIAKKIGNVKAAIKKVEQADQSPEVPAAVQELIKDKFAFAVDNKKLEEGVTRRQRHAPLRHVGLRADRLVGQIGRIPGADDQAARGRHYRVH